MSSRDQTTGPVFSSGWWVSIDFLRHVNPNPYELAGYVHLGVDQTLKELEAWANGLGLPYGVQVDRKSRTYECGVNSDD